MGYSRRRKGILVFLIRSSEHSLPFMPEGQTLPQLCLI
jgi:hypothetical protein